MNLLGNLYETQENIENTIKIVSNEMEETLTTILKQNPKITTVQGLLENLLKTIESVRINQTCLSEYDGQYMFPENVDIHYEVESNRDKLLRKFGLDLDANQE